LCVEVGFVWALKFKHEYLKYLFYKGLCEIIMLSFPSLRIIRATYLTLLIPDEFAFLETISLALRLFRSGVIEFLAFALYLNTLTKDLKGVKVLVKISGRKFFLVLRLTAIVNLYKCCSCETESKTENSFSA
jgi:hypothetical protein